MELITSLDTICRIVLRAREMEAQVPAQDADVEPDNVDDADEEGLSVLEDELNDSVEEELRAALDDLAEDQIAELLALAWVGQGTYDSTEWDDALEEANDKDAEAPVEQLLDMPMLAANLETGLAAFDLSCDNVGQLD